MGMAAGGLNKRIALQRNTPTKDAHGNPVDSWATLAIVWAKVIYGRGQERREAAQQKASVPATFQVRKSGITAGLAPADRLRFDPAGGRPETAPAWNIESVVPLDLDGIEITATTQKPGGGA